MANLVKGVADPPTAELTVSDVEIGAVEIKDATTSARAIVDATYGLSVDIKRSVAIDTELPAAVLLADNKAIPTTPIVGTAPMLYDGTTLYFERGNVQGTGLVSAVRTAGEGSNQIANYSGAGVMIILKVTVASGTGGLQVKIRGRSKLGNDFQINATPTAVTTTGTFVYEVGRGIATATGDIVQKTSSALPQQWYFFVEAGDGSSYTYSVDYEILLG